MTTGFWGGFEVLVQTEASKKMLLKRSRELDERLHQVQNKSAVTGAVWRPDGGDEREADGKSWSAKGKTRRTRPLKYITIY